MTVTSKWIDIDSADGKFGGYLALPHTGKGPGIILIQEIFGVNKHIREVAEQYAADGYVVLAPDVFWRDAPRIELAYNDADRAKGIELMKKVDFAKTLDDVAATGKTLRALPETEGSKIAIIGYCFGGLVAYNAAARGLVDAAVAYYGGGIQNQLDKAAQIKVPVQLNFGEADAHIPMADVKKIAETFADKEDVEVHIYPGADHGFNCPHRASYGRAAAALSHGNTLIFLNENL